MRKEIVENLNPDDIKGRMGGLARAKKLTPERRKAIATEAANKRWKSPKVRKNSK